MGTQRRDPNVSFQKMYPTVPGKCACGCGKKLPKGKRRWLNDKHSWKCYVQYALRAGDSAIIRRLVGERDKGICARCGTDTTRDKLYWRETERLWQWLAEAENGGLMSRFRREKLRAPIQHEWDERRERHWYARRLVEIELKARIGRKSTSGHWWEADHIKAVSEGGGGCGLENFQTLCIPCHKWKTRQLMRRLAAKKRALQPMLFAA